MALWYAWFNALWLLRPAFSRLRTCLWFVLAVAGLTVRTDALGASSVVRALCLMPKFYENLLAAFHSRAVKIDRLVPLWTQAVLKLFADPVLVNGRRVLVGDGIKAPKRGRKMPAVKLLHQESESNTKPEWITGHSLQAVSVLMYAAKSVLAVPLSARIEEGLVWTNRDKRTLLDKMITLLASTQISEPFYFVADAYYAAHKIVCGLLQHGNHLVTRMKSTAVAYEPYAGRRARSKGRPRKYGKKILLKSLLQDAPSMQEVLSPVYGENSDDRKSKTMIRYRVRDLLWRPAGGLVRFVAVIHPTRGSLMLMCTDISLDALEIIRLYGLRFKIEFTFKQAVRTIGAFGYHFWMKGMRPVNRGNRKQHLHRDTIEYREAIRRKMRAYHAFIHAGVVCQGLLQYLSASYSTQVWAHFGSWLRTVRAEVPPSELVVANALRQTLPQFLVDAPNTHIFKKFLLKRQGATTKSNRMRRLRAAA